jgi:hypothetical protein
LSGSEQVPPPPAPLDGLYIGQSLTLASALLRFSDEQPKDASTTSAAIVRVYLHIEARERRAVERASYRIPTNASEAGFTDRTVEFAPHVAIAVRGQRSAPVPSAVVEESRIYIPAGIDGSCHVRTHAWVLRDAYRAGRTSHRSQIVSVCGAVTVLQLFLEPQPAATNAITNACSTRLKVAPVGAIMSRRYAARVPNATAQYHSIGRSEM